MNNKILKLGSTELYNQVLADSFYDLPSDVPAGTTAIYKEGNTNGVAVKYEGRNNWVSETSEEYVPHTVTYKVGTDTYDTETVFDDKFPSPPVVSPAKAGYEFVSWQLDGTDYEFDEALTEDIELTANFIQLHKVTFKYLGKTYATEVVKNNGQCPIVGTPAPIGSYVVSGWKLNGADFDFTTAVTSDIELEVVITPVCDVVFVVNGVAFYKTTVLSGSTVSAPTAPAVSGYVFSKWKIGETDFTDETIITKDTKIDGIYVPAFKVSFATTDTDVSGMPEAQYVAEGGTATAPTPPTKEGYTFKQWLLNGEAFDFSTVITSDITLIAEFEEAGEEVIYEKTLTFVKETDTISDVNDNDTQYDTLGLIGGSKYTLIVGDNDYSMIGLEQQGIVALINEDYETAGMLNAVSPSTDGGIKITITSQEAFEGDRLVKIVKAEAPVEDVIWEDTLEFVSVEEEMPGWLMFNGEEAFPELDKLNTTDTFTFSIPELNKSVTGKFTKVSEEDNAYILGEEEDGINLQANTSFYVVAVEGDVEGTYTVKLTKSEAPAPSGYTWNGIDTSEKDVQVDGEGLYAHYVNTAPSEMAADYIGATLVYKLGDTETPYVLSEETIEDASEGETVAIALHDAWGPVAMVFKNYDGFDDGLFFLRDDYESSMGYGGYTSSLTLAE